MVSTFETVMGYCSMTCVEATISIGSNSLDSCSWVGLPTSATVSGRAVAYVFWRIRWSIASLSTATATAELRYLLEWETQLRPLPYEICLLYY